MRRVQAGILAATLAAAYGCGADEVAKPSANGGVAGGTSVNVPTSTLPTPNTGIAGAASTPPTATTTPPPISVPNQPPPVNPNTTPTTPPAGGMKPPAVPTDTTKPPPAGMTPMMPTGPAMPAPMGATDPVVPPMPSDCPELRGGTISYKSLGGISVVAGSKAASATAPMVFYWHGTGSFSGEYATMAAAVSQGVSQEGGVLISFQGSTGGDLLSGTAIFGKGDFELTDGLLACAVAKNNIDPRRVFATGCSAGGLFSGAMAAARSNYIAAAAPNSGGWTTPVGWQNGNTPALMTIHGAPGVDVVIIDFSNSSKTADMAFKTRGGFVINCNHGGGHCGGGGLAGDIWKFFKAHPYGTKPSPWASALPAGFNSKCMIF